MTNSSVSDPEARKEIFINRSAWLTLLLALGLIAALLFVFNAYTIAAPSETTISQRVQNTHVTSNSTVTGTYGEVLTVTMRFTITADTTLTGPVKLTTRFPGVITTPNNQLGLRFLDYQDPIAIGGGTPALAPTGFVSSTTGAAPNITTILTWTFDTITNPIGGSSYVYELPYQVRLVWDGVVDSGANVGIPNSGGQTYLTWSPYGPSNTKAANGLTVNLVKPDLSAPNSTKAFRAVPSVQGGATVVYTVTLKNSNASSAPAYDLAVTDSLDSNLTYVDASPAPSGVTPVSGQNTIITWTAPNWSLAPNATWVAYVTATLPSSIPGNPRYLNSVTPYYTTQPDSAPDEASYTPLISVTLMGGIAGTKRPNPADNVRIGDSVTYTVQFTVSPNVYLQTPIFTDTLPDGFHYRSASFGLSGSATLNGAVSTTTLGAKELLHWQINDVPAGGQQVFTAVYIADVTGINADGSLAYAANAGQFTSKQSAINSVQATWANAGGATLGLVAPLASTTLIAQPYLNNGDFGVGIFGWRPITASQEVGSIANYTLSVKNTGTITTYEVLLSDQLPPGVSYQGNLSINPSDLQIDVQPNVGDSGALQFGIRQLPAGTKAILSFDALVGNTARPGDFLTNQLSLLDYSSQPGGAFNRHYGAIALAVPAPRSASFLLKGLNAVKTEIPNPVLPGQVLTYFIVYSNTSAVYASNNVQIIDTYDPLLSFVSAIPAPGLTDPAAHTLTWNAGTLGANSGNNTITAAFQVATGISRTVTSITNTITSDSDAPAPPMSRFVTTTLVQPKPTINLDDKGISVKANDIMTYTMVYSNASRATGATTGTFTITLDYAPYTSFITYTAAPANPPGPRLIAGDGTVFTDTLGPGITRTVQLRMRVAQPLPYNLTSFTSTATIRQPAVDISDSDSEQTPVILPLFNLVATNSTPGNPPVGPGTFIGYNIVVTNTGLVTGTNIVITETWDPNTYNQAGTGWLISGNRAVYTITTLAPGATMALPLFTMNVTTTLPPDAQQIHNMLQLTSRDTTEQVTTYDTPIIGIFIQKFDNPDPVFPGQPLTYTILYTVFNNSSIGNPRITDTLPPAVTYVSCATSSGVGAACSYQPGSRQVIWSWTFLSANASNVLTTVVQAPATEGITLTNTYASSSDDTTYRTGPPVTTYVGRPHLSITKRASTAVPRIAPGDLITYTLTYTNSGTYKATNVMAHDTVPAKTTFSSCSGAPCSQTNGIVDWSLGDVPISTTGAITMVVRVNPNAGTTSIVNSVYSLSADRNVVNDNTPTAVSTNVVRPALAVNKSASPTWIGRLTDLITYTVRYTNTGGGLFTNLNFVDPLYVNTLFQSASPNCSNSSNTVSCTDTNLAPDQSRQFTITVKGNGVSNNEVITNAVTYSASNQSETLLPATTPPIEVLASNAGAAADFSGAPTSGAAPLNVTFTNHSSANSGVSITGCSWSFGDGSNSTSACQPGNQVSHAYNQAGVYTVALTINTNSGGGTNTRTRSAYITASGAAIFGVQIGSLQPNKSGPRGSQVFYTLVITNTGLVPDSFTLSLPSSGYKWSTTLSTNSTGILAAQSSTVVTATVNIPVSGPLFDSDVITVTAKSVGSSLVTNSVVLKTSTRVYSLYLPLIRK